MTTKLIASNGGSSVKRDESKLSRLLFKKTKKTGFVAVGVIDAGKHKSGDLTVAEIAFRNEFGFGRIPERSFMRSTLQEKRQEIISFQVKLAKKIISGGIVTEQALGLLGQFVSDLIGRKVVALRSPPNAPETIARKKSSNPLIDKKQLKNSITYKVDL